MFDFIDGTVVEKGPGHVVLKSGDIGFKISVPLSTFEAVREGAVRIYTILLVRDESIDIFGFLTRLEREVFRRLTSVGGIGPLLAMKVLSGISAADFIVAVSDGKPEALTAIKGVGRKTADRILLELKDAAAELRTRLGEMPESADEKVLADAAIALVKLGLGSAEARRAVEAARKTMTRDVTCEALIRKALG